MDAAEFGAGLRGDLHRWSLGRTLAHQFSLAAKRAPKVKTKQRPPEPVSKPGERWQRYRVMPTPPTGLAAVKHAQQQNAGPVAPMAPRGRRDGPSSRGELYEYYKNIGALETFFALFPDP